jgi:hypothetical protein
LASIGSISRAGRHRESHRKASPSTNPPRLGTNRARSGSMLGWLESRSLIEMSNSSA